MSHIQNGEIIIGGDIIKKYKISDIEKIEKTKEYKELRETVDKRRKKVAETNRLKAEQQKESERIETEKAIKMVDGFSIRVERITLDELKKLTLKAKEEWYNIHPRYKIVYNEFYCDDEYDYYRFMGYYCDSERIL